jgi:hypothetical protein
MRFDRIESLGGFVVLYFKDEEIGRLPIAGNHGIGMTEMPQKRNPMEGRLKWKDGSLMTGQQSTDEEFQRENNIA